MSHNICQFFESSDIDFTLVPNGIPDSIQVSIHNQVIPIKRLFELRLKGSAILMNVIKGDRCMDCLSQMATVKDERVCPKCFKENQKSKDTNVSKKKNLCTQSLSLQNSPTKIGKLAGVEKK